MPLTDLDTRELNEENFADTIDENDYVFVVSPTGTLKSVILPEEFDLDNIPEKIQKIMEALNASYAGKETIH